MLYRKKEYQEQKATHESIFLENALQYLDNAEVNQETISDRILITDTFTPKTIKRFHQSREWNSLWFTHKKEGWFDSI